MLHSWRAFTRALIAEPNQAARSALALGAARQLEDWGRQGFESVAYKFRELRWVLNAFTVRAVVLHFQRHPRHAVPCSCVVYYGRKQQVCTATEHADGFNSLSYSACCMLSEEYRCSQQCEGPLLPADKSKAHTLCPGGMSNSLLQFPGQRRAGVMYICTFECLETDKQTYILKLNP